MAFFLKLESRGALIKQDAAHDRSRPVLLQSLGRGGRKHHAGVDRNHSSGASCAVRRVNLHVVVALGRAQVPTCRELRL
jgi:hypothetical protein